MTEREQFLSDIIAGAVEGGTSYWACVSEYEDNYAVLHEEDEEGAISGRRGGTYSSTPLRLNFGTLKEAFKLLENEVKYLSNERREAINKANKENDAVELDADDCDVLAQLAVFGEIIYG